MDVERALVSKVIATGKYHVVVSRGIRSEMFSDEECEEAWDFIGAHTRFYRKTPSDQALRDRLPDFELEHVDDPIEYVIDRFMLQVRKRLAIELVNDLAEAISEPERASQIEFEFLEAARELTNIVPSDEVRRLSDSDKRRKEYDERVARGEEIGIPFGFHTLDDMTEGIQPHEFVVVASFTAVGKTTMLNAMSFNIYSQLEDRIALYISLEMEADALLRRFDSMVAGLNYKNLRRLKLSEEDLERWTKIGEEVRRKMKRKDILVLDKIRNCTPDKVFAATLQHNPDIVFVDYLSLMRSSKPNRAASMWQSVTEITQDMKQNARVLQAPIVAAAQLNRAGAKANADLESIAHSLSIVQDSDIGILLHADEEMRKQKRLEVKVRKNREGPLGQFTAVWDFDEMTFQEATPHERLGAPGPGSRQRPTRPLTAAQIREQNQQKRLDEIVAARKNLPHQRRQRPTRSR